MQEVGFSVEKYPYPVHDDERESYLLVGRWKGIHKKSGAEESR
jgi:hypothetical protein